MTARWRNGEGPSPRLYARIAGALYLITIVLGAAEELLIRGRIFVPKDAVATAANLRSMEFLWRVALLSVGLSWIAIGILAYALYVVLEPVNKRLAQLALVLRLGASFVGAASLMFRVAQARLYSASATEGLFTTEQLRMLAAVIQQGANAGITTSWMFMGAGYLLFFVLFLRSRYLPRALAGFGIFTSALLVALAAATFVFPERANELKLFAVPALLVEVATALWLLFKGLPRATEEARA